MKEIALLLVVVFVLLLIVGYQDGVFKQTCREAGGTPITSGYNKICYEPGVAIDVN